MNVATSICTWRFASADTRLTSIRVAVALLVETACWPVHSRDW
jgi:hypothetical protein